MQVTKGKPLKKKELEQFRELLLEEKKKLMHHLESLSDSAEEGLSQNSGDAADIASLEMNQASLQKIGKRESALLKKIQLALAKIEDGTYGECESCGEPIGAPRLMARPVAQLCIDCKTEQENMERKFSGQRETDEDFDEFGDEGESSGGAE